jgi:hypothetical protein
MRGGDELSSFLEAEIIPLLSLATLHKYRFRSFIFCALASVSVFRCVCVDWSGDYF